MNRGVKEGDLIVLTKFNGKKLDKPQFVTVSGINLDINLFKLDKHYDGIDLVYIKDSYFDEWLTLSEFWQKESESYYKETKKKLLEESNMINKVKKGDTIIVTKLNGRELDAPHQATVSEINKNIKTIVLRNPIKDCSIIYLDKPGYDVWYTIPEFQQKVSESLYGESDEQEPEGTTSTASSYENDDISPSYSEFINSGRGLTLADYTGVEITEDSLGFVSNVDEAISTITADSLNFSEELEDVVNHPSHYANGKFETIEMIEEITKGYDDGFVAHCVGTAVKYESRAPFKHDSPLEDLRKARKYLDFAIEHLERMED